MTTKLRRASGEQGLRLPKLVAMHGRNLAVTRHHSSPVD